jgi:hypothetical protein
MNCSICKHEFEGLGRTARPLSLEPCCDACAEAVVIPLQSGRLVARNCAQQIAEFALLLARQRARLAPLDRAAVKDMALLAATAMVAQAVERMAAPPVLLAGPRRGA